MNLGVIKPLVWGGLHGLGVNALARGLTRRSARIVTYHGVDADAHPVVNADRLQVPPAVFAAQLDLLARQYQVIPLRALVDGLLGRAELPSRALAITFDDGYRNNLEQAAPVLRAKGLPATFFVTTSFVNGAVEPWWYRLREAVSALPGPQWAQPGQPPRPLGSDADRARTALEWEAAARVELATEQDVIVRQLEEAGGGRKPLRYPLLTVDEVRALAGQGFDVQAHGDRHLSHAREDDAAVKAEIRSSVEQVRDWTGRAPWAYAYPYGHVPRSPAVLEALRAAGLQSAVGTQTGLNRVGGDVWRLNRYDLSGGWQGSALESRLAGVWPDARGDAA
jgi:peptidoglycan/xylan/chitin deacetylase (PgdA/CDA1 family)